MSRRKTGTATQEVILVDREDRCLGSMGKLEAHRDGGHLHRAFSIFIFDAAGRMLLQQRSHEKYHFAGRWTNACCGHPRPGEELLAAAHRRLGEEFGFDAPLKEVFGFVYRARDGQSGLTEHEFDHVLIGEFDGEPRPNRDEIAGWKWVDVKDLAEDAEANPERYTPWFRVALPGVLARVQAETEDAHSSGGRR
jgi:isopentenyl-diphosphate delta-isomerase